MQLTLQKIQEEKADVRSFYFEPDTEIEWKAGQFLHYFLPNPNPDERAAKRFFTIASAPHEKYILLTTRFATDHSSTFKTDLKNLKVGDKVEAMGPLGSFIVNDNYVSEGKSLCFIAGGIGVTPFRSILLDLESRSLLKDVTLLYANRDENNIVYKELFEELAQKNPTFKLKYVFDPQRIDEEVIKSSAVSLQSSVFYVSGPAPMVKGIEELLEKMGVERENILHDYFPGYSEI